VCRAAIGSRHVAERGDAEIDAADIASLAAMPWCRRTCVRASSRRAGMVGAHTAGVVAVAHECGSADYADKVDDTFVMR
jgi:hypothetical protein